ncbi:unnamed protein product, partial [Meganyctiphanes norvegica]
MYIYIYMINWLICVWFCFAGFLESFEEAQPEVPDTTVLPDQEPLITHKPDNVTVVLGNPVNLLCKAEGMPEPKLVWHSRKTGKVYNDKSRGLSIGHEGLSWTSVGKEDEGWYRCTARNNAGTKHSPWVYLNVLAKTHISEYPGGYSINYGTQLLMQCVALGDPLPEIQWFRNGEPVLNGIEFIPFTSYARSVLTVNATSTANYTCSANNVLEGKQTTDERTFTVSVVHPVDTLRRPLGYCAPYSGRVCRKHLAGKGLVWYNITANDQGGWLNEHITKELWAEMIDNFREPCRSAAEQLLCRFAFPSCYLENGYQTGLPICKEDCIAVRNLFCVNEWLLVQRNKHESKVFKTREHFRLPECEILPNYGKGEKKNICSNIGLT